ncbi:hypothetical protein J4G48_0031570 [Bradyrhizobium barranii subsp. apii]|uniref:hypothetical protein n=1 Tax=Bradyrhizobium barranii TaxID=2992140 RepID=UPI001AA1BFE4|nr:hypothetical protein [Bradyrhizobium barranii]UPT93853.1 hypothetical protein J4G48_0031570 [Bradyrhizobium barranii subsp. apii]
MTDSVVTAPDHIDPSTPFCAEAYFHALREAGCDPVVFSGGLYQNVGASEINQWAGRHDRSGKLRLEYARAMWASRASDDEIIALGVRQ